MELKKWKAQLKKGALQLLVLSMLEKEEQYGFDIMQTLKDEHDFVIAEGTLYPIFNRLTKAGLLSSKWVYADSGHHRKYYSLTKKGKKALKEMTSEWDGYVKEMNSMMGR